jgi:two-component system, NarL family, sensor kinase
MDAHETSIFSAVLITSIVLGVVLMYFIVTIVRHQRRNIRLYKSKILAEITTLEKERARIASDLHDELGPILSAVKFKINSLDIHNDEDQNLLDKSNKNIDEIIRRMREISNDLLPNTLLRKGLIAAIEESIDNFKKDKSININFVYHGIPDISKEKAIDIYRMIQEIIHNTLKHAKASELKIELKCSKQTLIILTEDNGRGFDYVRQSVENKGLGLRNLLSRTEVLGGDMYIDSKQNKGTKYTFEIPL